MRSKWLTWQPGDETIEETAHAQPTKPTKIIFEGFEGTAARDFPITNGPHQPCPPDFRARHEHAAAVINGLQEPPDLDEWLKVERPDLLALGRELFATIDRTLVLPDSTEFEKALALLTAHHGKCCRQYRSHLQNTAQGLLESLQANSGKAEGQSLLSTRAKKHSGAEAYTCPGCNGTWHTEANLARHMRECRFCQEEAPGEHQV